MSMTRYLIRARDEAQFREARALLDGRARVLVASERRLYLSAADLPEEVQEALRKAGADVSAEAPGFAPE